MREDTDLRVETTPAVVSVRRLDGTCRVDFSFEIYNGGADELVLAAIEQDVYGADGVLLQRRLVDEHGAPLRADGRGGSRIGPGEHRTIRNPLPEVADGMPLAELLYTLAFLTAEGTVVYAAVLLSSRESGTSSMTGRPAAALRERSRDDERAAPPTPRQLTRAWFETLYELGVYARA